MKKLMRGENGEPTLKPHPISTQAPIPTRSESSDEQNEFSSHTRLDTYVLIAEAALYYLVRLNVAWQRGLMIFLPSILSLQLRPL